MTTYLDTILTNLKNESYIPTEEEFLQLIQTADSLEKDFWFNFKPRSLQQRSIDAFQQFRNQFQVLLISGPNQIGKSIFGLFLFVDILTRRNQLGDWSLEPKHLGWFTKHRRFQVATIQRNLIKYCGEWLKYGLASRPGVDPQTGAFTFLEFKNDPANGFYGDVIQFETFEMPKENIEGYVMDAMVFDEGLEKYGHFTTATQRLITRGGPLVWQTIPGSKKQELYKKIVGPIAYQGKTLAFTQVVKSTVDDYIEARACDIQDKHNIPYEAALLKAKELVQYFRSIMPNDEFMHKIAGEWGGSETRVYPYDAETQIIKPFVIPDNWRRDVTMDYATSDNKWVKGQGLTKELKKAATTAVFIAMPPPGETVILPDGREVVGTHEEPIYFIYKEYYWTNEVYKRNATEHAQTIAGLFGRSELFETLKIDYAVDDSIVKEFNAVFSRAGQAYRFRKALDKARYTSEKHKQMMGHELVRTLYAKKKIYIFDTCIYFRQELDNYEIDELTQQPQSYGDHLMDPTRYHLNEYPQWRDPRLLWDSREEEVDRSSEQEEESTIYRNRISNYYAKSPNS